MMVDESQDVRFKETAPMQKGKNKKRVLLILLAILLLAALGAAGYLYWQLDNNKKELSRAEAEKTALEKKLSDSKKDKTPTEDPSTTLPVVVFSPGGLFTEAEKTQITTKMTNPYKAWHRDQGDNLVSIHIQQTTTTPTQYIVDAIHEDGVHESFLYGTVDAAEQPWWTPTCLGVCEFTDTFRASYPEVVAASRS